MILYFYYGSAGKVYAINAYVRRIDCYSTTVLEYGVCVVSNRGTELLSSYQVSCTTPGPERLVVDNR